MLAARVRHAHGVPTGLGKHGQGAVQQPGYGRVGDAKQEAEHLIGRVQAQPHHRQKDLLLRRQGKGVSTTHITLTPVRRAFGQEPVPVGLGKQRAKVPDKVLKLLWAQASEGVEHVRVGL